MLFKQVSSPAVSTTFEAMKENDSMPPSEIFGMKVNIDNSMPANRMVMAAPDVFESIKRGSISCERAIFENKLIVIVTTPPAR